MTDEPLFEATLQERFRKGDEVTVRTMWGEERAFVVDLHEEETFPYVTVLTDSGDHVSVGVARLTRRDP